MSLDKAIAHGKEHRAPYRGGKAIDKTCRNHGGCDFCLANRMHATRKRKAKMTYEQEEISLTKVFISQPMSGLSDEEITSMRMNIERKALRDHPDAVIIDSYFANFKGSPLEYLGKAISFLSYADVVYMAPGWKNSRGCRVEEMCAREYDIPVVYLEEATLD